MRVLVLLLVLALQPAPTLTAVWEPSGLRVTWSGAEPGSCLYLDGQFVPVPCGASGSALLPVRGVDRAYRPDPGDTLSLMRDETRGAVVEATVPRHETRLPIIAGP
ncbi:MAG TPA: hypothetical protein VFT99_05440 [Roseiflexaceae bacterium]|nr:hypothetical protein [Roseiflexaceae bacterium]